MNCNNSLKIAAIVLLFNASSARAQQNAGPVRSNRRAQILKAAATIDKFCGAADGWKIARFDPETGAWGELQKQDQSAESAQRRAALKAADADMGNWDQTDKDALRARVSKIRGQCAAMRSADGLTPLLAKDAALEKISDGAWSFLIEKLDEVALEYQGQDTRDAESASQYYLNYYGHKKATKAYGQADRINQLTLDSVSQLSEIVDRAVVFGKP